MKSKLSIYMAIILFFASLSYHSAFYMRNYLRFSKSTGASLQCAHRMFSNRPKIWRLQFSTNDEDALEKEEEVDTQEPIVQEEQTSAEHLEQNDDDAMKEEENPTVEEVEVLTPLQKAIQQKEAELKKQLTDLEATLKYERLRLGKLKDKKSESGKFGYYIVQAQVQDFLKKNEQEQKERVEQNKEEMVRKILPVIDMFRSSRQRVPAENDREESMHTNFGALLDSILLVLRKLGYEEYETAVGEKYDMTRHEIFKTVEGTENNIVQSSMRRGLSNPEGGVFRREQVILSRVRKEVQAEDIPATNENGQQENLAEGSVEATEEEHSGGEQI